MKDFPAADKPPADLCAERVRGCDVYVGLLGTRYGSPVRDRPDVSYTELEFDTATDAELERLVFLLDTDAEDVGIPPSGLMDLKYGTRQAEFRQRVQDSGLVTQPFTDPATLGQLVERSLRELADQRRRGLDRGRPAHTSTVVVTGEIPQEPLGFQPRADLLAALDAPGPGVRVVRALTGMRGVGKTHLAAAYARAKLAERWRLVAWINAEDEAEVLAGLAEVAEALGLAGETRDAVAAGRAVRHWLETDGDRCLLVFDNAVDARVLRPFIPATGAAQIVITSNQHAMTSLGTDVPVDVFSEAEALTFLAARTGQADAAGAQALAEEVGFLPLALAQAAAVIAGQHLPYETYLERLRRLPVEELLEAEEGGDYPVGVAAAVLIALDNVRADEGCKTVMNLLAVLSAAGVRRSLIHAALAPDLAAEAADRALARLAGVSLLTFSVDGSTVTAHRLVMRVIREKLAADGTLTAVCQAAADLLDSQAETLRQIWHEERPTARDLIEQIMSLEEFARQCPPGHNLGTRMVRLRWWALWLLNELDDSAALAIIVGERLLADLEQTLGPDYPDTLAARSHLAIAYWDVGRLAEAITLDEQVLATRERTLGHDHPDTLRSRNNLAVDYQDGGRTEEAITLHEQTLAARERILGPDHSDTLTSRSNLAIAYWDAGRTEEAINLDEQALAARERILGHDHPDTLTSRNNLAVDYSSAGRAAEAITLHEQNLAARERTLGRDHPDTLQSRNNLSQAYRNAGREDHTKRLEES